MLGDFVFNILIYFSCWVTSHRLAQDFPILLVKLKHIFSAEDKKRTEVEENWFQKLWAPTLHKKNQWVDLKTTKKNQQVNWIDWGNRQLSLRKESESRRALQVGVTQQWACRAECRLSWVAQSLHAKHPAVEKGLPASFSVQKNLVENQRFFNNSALRILKQSQLGFDSSPFCSFLLLQFYHSKCRRMSDDSSLGVFTSVWTYSFSFSFPFPPTIWGLLKSFFYLWKGTGQHDKEKFLIWTLNHFQNWKGLKGEEGRISFCL